LQCPNCGDQTYYHTYANGTVETGYCQRCSHESLTETKKRDPFPEIRVEKPLKQGKYARKNR